MPKVSGLKWSNQSKPEEQYPIDKKDGYQQPPSYPPQQALRPFIQQPVQPPLPRKKLSQATRYLIFSVIGLIIIIGGGLFWQHYIGSAQSISNGGTQSISSSSSSGTWTTTHNFSGNGIKQTEVFTIADDWKLQWTCDPNSFGGSNYNVIVMIYSADGTLTGGAVNTLCSASNTGDSTELHQGGSIYLSVNSEAAWTLTIQELQ